MHVHNTRQNLEAAYFFGILIECPTLNWDSLGPVFYLIFWFTTCMLNSSKAKKYIFFNFDLLLIYFYSTHCVMHEKLLLNILQDCTSGTSFMFFLCINFFKITYQLLNLIFFLDGGQLLKKTSQPAGNTTTNWFLILDLTKKLFLAIHEFSMASLWSLDWHKFNNGNRNIHGYIKFITIKKINAENKSSRKSDINYIPTKKP
jgi:hypothetical protein